MKKYVLIGVAVVILGYLFKTNSVTKQRKISTWVISIPFTERITDGKLAEYDAKFKMLHPKLQYRIYRTNSGFDLKIYVEAQDESEIRAREFATSIGAIFQQMDINLAAITTPMT